MGPECAIFVKHIAKKMDQKKNQDLPDAMRAHFLLNLEIMFTL